MAWTVLLCKLNPHSVNIAWHHIHRILCHAQTHWHSNFVVYSGIPQSGHSEIRTLRYRGQFLPSQILHLCSFQPLKSGHPANQDPIGGPKVSGLEGSTVDIFSPVSSRVHCNSITDSSICLPLLSVDCWCGWRQCPSGPQTSHQRTGRTHWPSVSTFPHPYYATYTSTLPILFLITKNNDWDWNFPGHVSVVISRTTCHSTESALINSTRTSAALLSTCYFLFCTHYGFALISLDKH